MRTRILSSFATGALALSLAAPAFAHLVAAEPPFPMTHMRRQMSLREEHVTYPPFEIAYQRFFRTEPRSDTAGYTHLSRGRISVTSGRRNLNRHMLGMARGGDMRVLDTRGGAPRRITQRPDLPSMLLRTGAGRSQMYGSWGWDRPTRRDIHGD